MRILWAALAALCVAAPAAAQDCNKPLRMLASLPMTPLGVNDVVTIPVSINGVKKQFLFDTGGVLPMISAGVADELKLSLYSSGIQIYAADGTKSDHYVKIDKFTLGNLPPAPARMQIAPNKGVDGIFSPMIFKSVDFDMDFSGRKLNLLLGDHCEGKVIYWPHKAVAIVPFTVDGNHITVPVTVDGHNFTAIIDTGASTTVVRLDVARYIFKIPPDSSDLKAIGHVGSDEKALIYSYPFKSLSFEGITVTNPAIHVYTDIMNKGAMRDDGNNGLQTGSRIQSAYDNLTLPQVIVGMDVLSRLHPYLALSEKRLYLTEVSAPPAP